MNAAPVSRVQRWRRRGMLALLLAVVPAAAGYLLFELKVRTELRGIYAGNATPMLVINQALTYWAAVDDAFGRRFTQSIGDLKVNETFTMAFIANGETALQARVRTNNLGFLSDRRYEASRGDTAEYRIWFAGDSMTGTTTMNFQWVDLVEDLLNSSEELRRAVGGKVFRTYNGGTPGAGFRYFWDYYERAGKKLDPDLIIVNYIESDFPRMGKGGNESHTDDEGLMIRHAAEYAGKLRAEAVPVVFTLMPLYQDLYPHPSPYHRTQLLQTAIGGDRIEIMRDRLDWQNRQVEARGWYNLPHDGHMSDWGGRVYAAAMAGLIGRRLTGNGAFRFPEPVDSSAFAKRISPNLIANPHFQGWGDQAVTRLSAPGTEVTQGWGISVDGQEGKGLVEVSRTHVASPVDGNPSAGSGESSLRVVSIRESTAGVPSVHTKVPVWRSFAGRALELSLQLRAAQGFEGEEVMVRLYVDYGAGRSVTRGHELYYDKFRLTGEWSNLSIPLLAPTPEGKEFGPPGSDYLLLQIMAPESGKPYGIEFRNPGLHVVERPTGRPSIVMVGNRELLVLAFNELRAEINERFIRARRSSTRLYGWNRIRGKDSPYSHLPAGVPLIASGIRMQLRVEPPEDVFLNVYCIGGSISLDSEDCFHTYQVYAR